MESTVVIVPMYDEAAVVGTVVGELCTRFERIVCIDDGSRDASAAIAREAGATVLAHPVNLGQGAALQTGFEYVLARTDAAHVVTFDADGQHCVDDAVTMVSLAGTGGYDIVLGSRNLGRTTGQRLSRRLLLSAALRYSRRTTGLALTDTHNGLRVLSRRAVAAMGLQQRGMAYASELESRITSHGLTWTEHPVTVNYTAYSRAKGQSNLNAINILFDLVEARLGTAS